MATQTVDATAPSADPPRLTAALAYVLGFASAFLVWHLADDEFARFHAAQAFLIAVAGVVGNAVAFAVAPAVAWVWWLAVLAGWVTALVAAARGSDLGLPIVGALAARQVA